MSVRKRQWHTSKQISTLARQHGIDLSEATEQLKQALRDGDATLLEQYLPHQAWVVDYVDQHGHRHIQTFARKKEADAYSQQTGVDIRAGVHTAPSRSITVAQAGEDWIDSVALEKREASTLAQYRQHAHHINQRIGNLKLANLTAPGINNFRDDLLKTMSRALARKVMSSLKSLLRHAQSRGNVAQNAALAVSIKANPRDKRRL